MFCLLRLLISFSLLMKFFLRMLFQGITGLVELVLKKSKNTDSLKMTYGIGWTLDQVGFLYSTCNFKHTIREIESHALLFLISICGQCQYDFYVWFVTDFCTLFIAYFCNLFIIYFYILFYAFSLSLAYNSFFYLAVHLFLSLI